MEREKQEVKDKIAEMKEKIEAYTGKVKLAQDEKEHLAQEKLRKKELDLVEKNSQDRKNVRKVEQRDNASSLLAERRCF